MSSLSDDLPPRRRRPSTPAHSAQRPPCAVEAEAAELGCVLWDQKALDVMLAGGRTADDYYDLRHGTVFDVMVGLREAREPVTVETVVVALRGRKLLDDVGGVHFVSALQDASPSAAGVEYFSEAVTRKAAARRMVQVLEDGADAIRRSADDEYAVLDAIERDVLKVCERRGPKRAGVKQLVHAAIGWIEDKFNAKGRLGGLPTGFADLDRATDGMHPGDLIVPAADTSVGKTSLAMNVVEHVLLSSKFNAAVFSLEMTAEQLVRRLLVSAARVDVDRLRDGELVEGDFPALTSWAGAISRCGLHVVDDVDTLQQIRAEARRLHQEHGLALVVVDYIQLVAGAGKRDGNREQEVSAVAAGLKAMARELRVPVIAPSQVNEDGRLRESRAIGQHADQVWSLERNGEEKDAELAAQDGEAVSLWLLKNRNGRRGVRVDLTFMKCFTRFENAARGGEPQ